MAYDTNKYNINKHGCNVISNPLNPTKCTKFKINHYSPILQGCMSTRSGREMFSNFQIILDSGRSSIIVLGKPT